MSGNFWCLEATQSMSRPNDVVLQSVLPSASDLNCFRSIPIHVGILHPKFVCVFYADFVFWQRIWAISTVTIGENQPSVARFQDNPHFISLLPCARFTLVCEFTFFLWTRLRDHAMDKKKRILDCYATRMLVTPLAPKRVRWILWPVAASHCMSLTINILVIYAAAYLLSMKFTTQAPSPRSNFINNMTWK